MTEKNVEDDISAPLKIKKREKFYFNKKRENSWTETVKCSCPVIFKTIQMSQKKRGKKGKKQVTSFYRKVEMLSISSSYRFILF
jgi:hypothetical protein